MGIFDNLFNKENSKEDEFEVTTNSKGNGRKCINCQQLLADSEFTAEWEDGDNESAYITCRHCGFYNIF